jgi:hypothetical protein
MKKLIIFMFSIVLLGSCAKEGCTDPQASNYNTEASKDDGTCKYSILGEWYANSRIINGNETINDFSYYTITFNPTGTYLIEMEDNVNGYTDIEGVYSIDGTNSNLITMQNTYQNDYDNTGWFINDYWTIFECSEITANAGEFEMTNSNWASSSGVNTYNISVIR